MFKPGDVVEALEGFRFISVGELLVIYCIDGDHLVFENMNGWYPIGSFKLHDA